MVLLVYDDNLNKEIMNICNQHDYVWKKPKIFDSYYIKIEMWI